jgi:hypothetical protein
MSEETRKIFIEGKPVDYIKDDQKLTNFFEEFDDKVFQSAEKQFKEICEKFDVDASFTVLIKFKEE